MAKKKKPDAVNPPPDPVPEQPMKKRPPSREKLRYVALPLDLHQFLKDYADSKSNEDDKRSVNWAARVAIRRFRRILEEAGEWPPDEAEPG
jgi:hypothetical protein